MIIVIKCLINCYIVGQNLSTVPISVGNAPLQTFFYQETFDISQNSPGGKPEKIQWSEKRGPCNEYYECIIPGVF